MGRHVWVQSAGEKAHIVRSPSRDAQPDQLSPASGRDIHDPPRSLGVEHDAPGHLRLDGHFAVDAERRTALVGAHVFDELVGARHQHDPAHRAITECRNEITRVERVPRARLQRRRGRRGRQRRGRGRRGRQRGWRGRRGRRGWCGRRWRRRCPAAHRHLRQRRVAPVASAAPVLKGKRRRVYIDAHGLPRVALVAAQAPHRLPRSVGHAKLAHFAAVHVVVEGHGTDDLANGGARGAVVGEREEFALRSTAHLGVEVGPRPVNTGRGAGARGRRPVICLCESIWRVAATIRPAGARGAAEVECCGWLRWGLRGRRGRRGRQGRRGRRRGR
eukprot:scaffold6125_cov69-Phaeocystis_antarctica.AAC.1